MRLVVASPKASGKMQRDGNEYVYIFDKAAALQCGICQETECRGKFGSSGELEGKEHFLQGVVIDAGTGDLIEKEIFALTVRAGSV